MRFLVTRVDALQDSSTRRRISGSDIWPTVVEADSHSGAVAIVYEQHFGKSQPLPLNREFLVVALIDASVIKFTPKRDYTVECRPY